ncbi:hypothetical protein [Arthrobacter globiformis]|uniref:hypothetical protein n=1 Tax=Arthrobacter globiformis TaxID=1665 RepID=UPI001124CF94|nr:hypothetical protein [Arthrobacter globiformis]
MEKAKGRNTKESSRRDQKASTLGNNRFPWLTKPFVWAGTIILAALATALTSWLQPRFTGAIDAITESGDPISITYALKPATTLYDVSLPAGRPLSDADIEHLNRMKPNDQVQWLEKNGGTPLGARTLTVTLKGNRTHLVRVTDIRPVSECTEPSRGSLMLTGLGRGATQQSLVLYLNVGDPTKGAEYYSPETGEKVPFFPQKTITLTNGEEEYLVINLVPSNGEHCHVQVEFAVTDGNKEVRRRVPHEGPISIMPASEAMDVSAAEQYPKTYLGADFCKRIVELPEGARKNGFIGEDACGPGNVTRIVDGK